jgi:hypothetical protein
MEGIEWKYISALDIILLKNLREEGDKVEEV